MAVEVKICGLSTPEAIDAAVAGGASHVGVVFFPPSPRYVRPGLAAELCDLISADVQKVGLFVNPGDNDLAEILASVRLDMLQLHGSESPARVEDIRQQFALPVIKSILVHGDKDIEFARRYEDTADMLLFDSKPPKNASRPGGNALAFDWELLGKTEWRIPWLLAGGLTSENLAEAVHLSGARMVDVSSGVEDTPGHKNLAKIEQFLKTAASLG